MKHDKRHFIRRELKVVKLRLQRLLDRKKQHGIFLLDLIGQRIERFQLLLKPENKRLHMREQALIQGKILRQINAQLCRYIANHIFDQFPKQHTIVIQHIRRLDFRTFQDHREKLDIALR